MKKISLLPALLLLLAACNGKDKPKPEDPKNVPQNMSYSVVASYPHDTTSFTEGLLFYKGELYESTGQNGQSKILKVDLKTGKTLKSLPVENNYFGEGIIIVNDTIYQLTYQEKVGLKYSLKDFKKIGEFKFASNEGWGMTYDGTHIIASDGTNRLYFYEPSGFTLKKTLDVLDGSSPAYNLNELEYINGYIYANHWQTSYIYKIDPGTGQILAKADLSELLNKAMKQNPNIVEQGMNGIAYDTATKKTYVTGKNWPEIYEVQFGQ